LIQNLVQIKKAACLGAWRGRDDGGRRGRRVCCPRRRRGSTRGGAPGHAPFQGRHGLDVRLAMRARLATVPASSVARAVALAASLLPVISVALAATTPRSVRALPSASGGSEVDPELGTNQTMVFTNSVDAADSVSDIPWRVGLPCILYHRESSLERRTSIYNLSEKTVACSFVRMYLQLRCI
jgi:hypothetical protein